MVQRAFRNLVIRASAGTGKTFQLSNRYLSLLHHGAPPDQILASTFTRKAAGEILDRVMLRLAEAALDENHRRQLAEHLQLPDLTRARCLLLLEQLTRSLHRLRICTLDSFFSQVAGSFSLELGLPPGWRIVEPLQDAQLRTEAIESVLREQSEAVIRLMNLITKGDAERSISELVRSTVNNLYSLYQETDRAAWTRFPTVRVLSPDQLQVTIAALESASMPPDKRFEKSRQTDLERAREGFWEELIQGGLAGKVAEGETTYYRKPIPPDALGYYETLVDHARSTLIQQLARQTEATYELLDRFHHVYQQLKLRYRALTFDDVTRQLADAQQHLGVDHVDFRLDAPLSHLLLDEFQDTSLPQWQALRPFAERVTETGGQQSFLWLGGQTSFFCVGDGKQAIYGWRGGRSEIFDALEAHLNGLDHEELTCSFRSAVPVIETVNRIFRNLTRHPNLEAAEAGVQKWLEQFQDHSTARTELSGYVRLEVAPQSEDETESAEDATLRYAAEQVAQLHRQSPNKTVGVLVRKNRTVARMIFELRRLGVKASEEGGNPLTDSAAVTVVLSLLRLADHPADKAARFHVAHSLLGPALGLTDYDNEAAAHRVAFQVRRDLLQDGYGTTLRAWARILAPACNARDQRRLEQLVERAYAFQPASTLRTMDFVRQVENDRVADPSPARIRVMTIHQSKGLQFDAVFLPDLDDSLTGQTPPYVVGQSDPTERIDRVCLYRNSAIQNLLPDDLRRLFDHWKQHQIAESLCVLYVAVTRAVQGLYLILRPRPGEGKLPKTAAGLLRAALTDGSLPAPGTVAFEHGKADWFREDPKSSQPSEAEVVEREADSSVEVPPVPQVRLAAGAGSRAFGLGRAAPSSLEGGNRVELGHALRLDNARALARGTMVHAFFEQVLWLDDGVPDRDRLTRLAKSLPHQDLDVDEVVEQFYQMLANPSVAEVLERRYYRKSERDPGTLQFEVQNERTFAVRSDSRLVSGAIDRLVLLSRDGKLVGADIVDFKTDVTADAEARRQQLVEYYRPQQEAYRQAVAQMYRLELEQISSRLVLLHAGCVEQLAGRALAEPGRGDRRSANSNRVESS